MIFDATDKVRCTKNEFDCTFVKRLFANYHRFNILFYSLCYNKPVFLVKFWRKKRNESNKHLSVFQLLMYTNQWIFLLKFLFRVFRSVDTWLQVMHICTLATPSKELVCKWLPPTEGSIPKLVEPCVVTGFKFLFFWNQIKFAFIKAYLKVYPFCRLIIKIIIIVIKSGHNMQEIRSAHHLKIIFHPVIIHQI